VQLQYLRARHCTSNVYLLLWLPDLSLGLGGWWASTLPCFTRTDSTCQPTLELHGSPHPDWAWRLTREAVPSGLVRKTFKWTSRVFSGATLSLSSTAIGDFRDLLSRGSRVRFFLCPHRLKLVMAQLTWCLVLISPRPPWSIKYSLRLPRFGLVPPPPPWWR